MAKKKKKVVEATDFVSFIKFVRYFKYVDVYQVEEESFPALMELLENEEDDYLDKFEKVTKMTFMLTNADFMNVLAELNAKDFIKHDVFFKFVEVGDELYVLELINDKSTKRRRKTKVEVELELDEALSKEDYKLAAKLRDKLEKMSK